MKFKMTADSRDWLVFGAYCVALLFFVAIAELNIIQFAKGDLDHMFWGMNPLPAFSSEYIGITIPLYLVAVGASLFSVKDRFFTMEKGVGISTKPKPKSDGYSRWLSEKEIKKELTMVRVNAETADAGGIPLINDGKKMWVDNGEGHNLIIGSTGAGKTQVAIFPLVHSLAKHGESMIITDPKGEIYETTANMLKKRGYNVILLNFRDPQSGSGWNPLHLPYKYYKEGNIDKANELTDDLAINILYDEAGQNNDPFWQNASANYFSGICLGLFDDANEDEINLNSINAFTTVGEERIPQAKSIYATEYFKLSKDPNSSAYVSAASAINAPTDTHGSIISVFQQKIRLFASRENLSEMLSHSDFEFEDIGKKKTAVFIVIQDEKKTYHSLVTIFLKQCYETLVGYAQKCGGKLPYRTNFLLDEFANMPPLKDVDTMVSAARSRNMRFYFVIQNFAQLSEVYGKEKGDTIRGNCTNTIYLISSELAALEEISKMCGEIKVKTKDKDGKEKEENRPLITVSDLQNLKMGEIILLRLRMHPFRTKLKLDYQIDWGDKCEKATYPIREKRPIKVFDLKAFVNKKREEKLSDFVNQLGPNFSNSFGNSTGSNPFGMNNAFGINTPKPKPDNKAVDMDAFRKNIMAGLDAKIEEEKKNTGTPVAKIEPVKVPVQMPKAEVKEVVNSDSKLKNETIKVQPIPRNISNNKPKIDFGADFASKITAQVNKKVKDEELKQLNKITVSNDEEKKVNGVTDDQFFDDFFSDDD